MSALRAVLALPFRVIAVGSGFVSGCAAIFLMGFWMLADAVEGE